MIRHNRILSNRYYEMLDFINMHFCMTRRTDSAFWREAQKPERVNNRPKAKLAFWRMKPPSAAGFEDACFMGVATNSSDTSVNGPELRPSMDTAQLWNHQSYECILYGMGFLDKECDQRYGTNRPPMPVHPAIFERLKAAKVKLPPHAYWLKQILGMDDYPSAAKPAGWI